MIKTATFIYIILLLMNEAKTQTNWNATTLRLPEAFHKALQISSMAWVGDSLYLPTEKCGSVLIGKCVNGEFVYRTAHLGITRQTEGLSFYNGNFYLCDDMAYEIYQYNSDFSSFKTLPVVLREGDERINGSNGFEGIAVANDTTFYLLLEKESSKKNAVLYKAVLRNRQVVIIDKIYLPVDSKSRYCDLHVLGHTLYLLRTSYYGNNCDSKNKYEIHSLALTKEGNVQNKKDTMLTKVFISISNFALNKCHTFNTNVEGIATNNEGEFYFVSDNYWGDSCDADGEKNTLLMKVTKAK